MSNPSSLVWAYAGYSTYKAKGYEIMSNSKKWIISFQGKSLLTYIPTLREAKEIAEEMIDSGDTTEHGSYAKSVWGE